MFQFIDSSFLQTVVFVDLRRDLVNMYRVNDASSRWNTYPLGLSDVRVIVAVTATFRWWRRVFLSSGCSVYYTHHRAQKHILTFCPFSGAMTPIQL